MIASIMRCFCTPELVSVKTLDMDSADVRRRMVGRPVEVNLYGCVCCKGPAGRAVCCNCIKEGCNSAAVVGSAVFKGVQPFVPGAVNGAEKVPGADALRC